MPGSRSIGRPFVRLPWADDGALGALKPFPIARRPLPAVAHQSSRTPISRRRREPRQRDGVRIHGQSPRNAVPISVRMQSLCLSRRNGRTVPRLARHLSNVAAGRFGPGGSVGRRTARNERGAVRGLPLHPAASGIAVRWMVLRFGAAAQRSGGDQLDVIPRRQGDEEGPALVDVADKARRSRPVPELKAGTSALKEPDRVSFAMMFAVYATSAI